MSDKTTILAEDVWLGGALALAGGAAAWDASGFDASSRVYPFTLSAAIALAGVWIGLRPLLMRRRGLPVGSTGRVAGGIALVAAVLVAWIVCLDLGVGYLLPTVLASFALLWIAGVRERRRLIVDAVSVAAGVFVLFGVIFATPLPVLEPLQFLLRE